jgi:hypothetical protein
MMNFTQLTCSNCGGNLQQVENSNRWICMYCRAEQLLDNATVAQPIENALHQKTLSDLRAETRELLMDVVLAVGGFTSLYPGWKFSQWLHKEKGQAGELGAYRGVFLDRLTRNLSMEVNEKRGKISHEKGVKDGDVLVDKLLKLQKEITDKKLKVQNLCRNGFEE